MKLQRYNVLENLKMVVLVVLAIMFCVAAWLVLSLVAGQTI